MTEKNTTTPEPLNETQRFLLTAYVFDELTPDGRTSVEAKLRESDTWRAELESIRTAQKALNAAFESDAQTATLEMTDKQYDELMAEAERNGNIFMQLALKSKRRRKLLMISSAAAVLFLMCLAVTVPALSVKRQKASAAMDRKYKSAPVTPAMRRESEEPHAYYDSGVETTIVPDGWKRDEGLETGNTQEEEIVVLEQVELDEETDETSIVGYTSMPAGGWENVRVRSIDTGKGGLRGRTESKDKASKSDVYDNASFRAESKSDAEPNAQARNRPAAEAAMTAPAAPSVMPTPSVAPQEAPEPMPSDMTVMNNSSFRNDRMVGAIREALAEPQAAPKPDARANQTMTNAVFREDNWVYESFSDEKKPMATPPPPPSLDYAPDYAEYELAKRKKLEEQGAEGDAFYNLDGYPSENDDTVINGLQLADLAQQHYDLAIEDYRRWRNDPERPENYLPQAISNLDNAIKFFSMAAENEPNPEIAEKLERQSADARMLRYASRKDNHLQVQSNSSDFAQSVAQDYGAYSPFQKYFFVNVPSANAVRLAKQSLVESNPQLISSHIPFSTAETAIRSFKHQTTASPASSFAPEAIFQIAQPVPPALPTDDGLGEDDFLEKFGFRAYIETARDNLSTFGLDVSTASWNQARASLRAGRLPDPKDIHIEEFLNSFKPDFKVSGDDAFGILARGGKAPFGGFDDIWLLEVGIRSRKPRDQERKPIALTLVIDSSGSMARGGRMAMTQTALTALVNQLRDDDSVCIVSFSDRARVLLPMTRGSRTARIKTALDALTPSGGTNVESGLNAGCALADEAYSPRAINRLIIVSDGVGVISPAGPERALETVKVYAARGIDFITVGVGIPSNGFDGDMMRRIATQGNGAAYFIDDEQSARRVFVSQLPPHVDVLARDAKLQVKFNPDAVEKYRLLGYDKRKLKDNQFRDDTVDAGEIAHDTHVTALYELRLKPFSGGNLATVQLRYKDAGYRHLPVIERHYDVPSGIMAPNLQTADPETLFLACVAEFGELLRGNRWSQDGSYSKLIETLETNVAPRLSGWRRKDAVELITLATMARRLTILEFNETRYAKTEPALQQ